MKKLLLTLSVAAFAVLLIFGHTGKSHFIVDAAIAQVVNEARLVGQFSGQLMLEDGNRRVDAELEVMPAGGNDYRATLNHDGLAANPSSTEGAEEGIELEGTFEDYTLILEGDFPLKLQFIHGRFTALDEENNYRGHLDSVVQVRPTP